MGQGLSLEPINFTIKRKRKSRRDHRREITCRSPSSAGRISTHNYCTACYYSRGYCRSSRLDFLSTVCMQKQIRKFYSSPHLLISTRGFAKIDVLTTNLKGETILPSCKSTENTHPLRFPLRIWDQLHVRSRVKHQNRDLPKVLHSSQGHICSQFPRANTLVANPPRARGITTPCIN